MIVSAGTATAGLAAVVAGYVMYALEVSMSEIQKLAYFLQVAGEHLGLTFEKQRYGPCAAGLPGLVGRLDGVVDGREASDVPADSMAPVALLRSPVSPVASVETGSRVARVLALADGFESAYGMELLAAVNWAAATCVETAADAASIADVIGGPTSNRHLFTPTHVRVAWRRLDHGGWLLASGPDR